MESEEVAVAVGSVPLAGRLERFAQLLALNLSCEDAAREAHYPDEGNPATFGANARKRAQRRSVRERVACLKGDETAIMRDARALVGERLMKIANFDILKQFGIVESYETEDGRKVGRLVGIDWAALKDSEASVCLSSFKFDGKGRLVDFSRDDALGALAQYRDMYGLKSVTKIAATDPSGQTSAPLQVVEIVRFTDAKDQAAA